VFENEGEKMHLMCQAGLFSDFQFLKTLSLDFEMHVQSYFVNKMK